MAYIFEGQMKTASLDETPFIVGKDFVECAYLRHNSKEIKSHGVIGCNIDYARREHRYNWFSTLSISETEHALRVYCNLDGAKITYFESQAQ
jgi:hypothetical protein